MRLFLYKIGLYKAKVAHVAKYSSDLKRAILNNEDEDLNLKLAVVKGIDNRLVLREIIASNMDNRLIFEAIERLNDDNYFLGYLNDKTISKKFPAAAIERLIDEEKVLTYIFENPNSPHIALLVRKIKNPIFHLRIACGSSNKDAITHSIEQLNENDLKAVFEKAEDQNAKAKALHRIEDQSYLKQVALSTYDSKLRMIAVWKIQDENTLIEIAENESDESVRNEAILGSNHQDLLGRLAMYHDNNYIRERAVEKISDEKVLARVAIGAKLSVKVETIYEDVDIDEEKAWDRRHGWSTRSDYPSYYLGEEKVEGPWINIMAVDKIRSSELLKEVINHPTSHQKVKSRAAYWLGDK